MNGRCIAVFALALLLSSCDVITGVFRGASLQVTAYGDIGDPKGLVGLEVQVDNRVFTAADLPSERFEVAEHGTINFAVALRQEGIVAFEGHGSWALEPDVEWELEVERAVYPSGAPPGHPPRNLHSPNPDCYWFWCSKVWRWELKEEMLNDEDEALWVTLWRVHPNECVDVC